MPTCEIIKRGVKGMESDGVEWIYVSQNREQCRVFVSLNTVMNVRFPWNAGNSFGSWAPVSSPPPKDCAACSLYSHPIPVLVYLKAISEFYFISRHGPHRKHSCPIFAFVYVGAEMCLTSRCSETARLYCGHCIAAVLYATIWIWASLLPEQLNRICSYCVLKDLSIMGRYPVNLNTSAWMCKHFW